LTVSGWGWGSSCSPLIFSDLVFDLAINSALPGYTCLFDGDDKHHAIEINIVYIFDFYYSNGHAAPITDPQCLDITHQNILKTGSGIMKIITFVIARLGQWHFGFTFSSQIQDIFLDYN
jgi:hypothetical protein